MKRAFAERFGQAHDQPPASTTGFDDSAWPVVRASIGAGFDDKDVCALLDRVSTVHKRGRFVLVVDLRRAPLLTPTWRHLLAAARAADDEAYADGLAAQAFVVATEEQQRAVLPLLWLVPAKYPRKTFLSFDDAVAWAHDHR